jgi:hypothetical protein
MITVVISDKDLGMSANALSADLLTGIPTPSAAAFWKLSMQMCVRRVADSQSHLLRGRIYGLQLPRYICDVYACYWIVEYVAYFVELCEHSL